MNRVAITIITSLLLTVSGLTLAKDFYGKSGTRGQQSQRGMQEMPIVKQLMHGIKRLDLGNEQTKSIRKVMQGLKTKVRPIMLETRAGHVQLKELIKTGSYDENAVAVLAKKEGGLAAERFIITSKAMSEVLSHLTDAQRTELDDMATKRMARRDQRRKADDGES